MFGALTSAFSQQSNITIEFRNLSLKEALIQLEVTSGYKFYFQEEWFVKTDVSGAYSQKPLSEILSKILENSNLNFFIRDKSVVLTKNSFIFKELPENYFNTDVATNSRSFANSIENSEEDENSNAPVLQKNYVRDEITTNIKYLAIGRSEKDQNKTHYSVSGIVKDFITKRPVQDIVVAVKGQNMNAVTDENGYYTLKLLKGTYQVYTKSLAYENSIHHIVVYGSGELNFELIESLNLLNEIVIQSDKRDNIKEVMVGITNINVKEIKNIPLVLGERDVLKVATTMPGIKTQGEGAMGLNVRGGKADQNLLLFDNAVLYNASHFFGIFSAINPFTTGNVEIYKGTIPAQYGGRLSSVIDIRTKKSNIETFSGEGSIGPVTGNLTVQTPIVKGKSSLMTGFRATYSNWLLKTIKEESVNKSQASFYDGVLKYNHKFNDNNDLNAMLYYSYDNFSITSDSIFAYKNRLASLEWNHTFNSKNRGSFQIANTSYQFNIGYENDNNRNFDYNYSIQETELKGIIKYNYSKTHKFDYGLSSKVYIVEPGERKPLGSNSIIDFKKIEQEKGLEAAVFLSDEFKFNERLSLNIGLRYSLFTAVGGSTQNKYAINQPVTEENVVESITYGNNEIIKTYGGFEPRLAFRYFLTPTLSLKGGFNKTIQYIHLLSSNTSMSPVDTWKLSNLNIKPQKATQFSLGLFKNFENDKFEVSLDSYYKTMDNILDFKIGAELSLNDHIETQLLPGQGRAYGIEFLVKKKKGRFNGWIGYSYSRSEIKLDSNFLTERVNNGEFFASNYDRPHDFNIVSNFKLTNRYSFSMNFNYQTGRPITYPVGKFNYNGKEQIIYSDRNANRIPDYYRLDLGINIEGNHKIKKLAHSFWNISVYNVLGRSNPYSVYFVNEQDRIKAYKTSIFAIPIPTITYNFTF